MDSLPSFPCKNIVHPDTETRLTSRFGMSLGEPRPYGRPGSNLRELFIKIVVEFGVSNSRFYVKGMFSITKKKEKKYYLNLDTIIFINLSI
jgi:hypothetical protein